MCLAAPQALVRMQAEGLPSCHLSGSAGSPLNYIQTVKRDKCSEEAEQGGHGVLGMGGEVLMRRCPLHKDEVSRKSFSGRGCSTKAASGEHPWHDPGSKEAGETETEQGGEP